MNKRRERINRIGEERVKNDREREGYKIYYNREIKNERSSDLWIFLANY